MKNVLRKLSITLLSILTIACSTLPDQPSDEFNLKKQQRLLKSLDNWKLKGRMAFKSDTQKSFGAYISWNQEKSDYDFSMNTLLGVSVMKLQGNDAFATMSYDNQTYNSTTPNQFIESLTGWDIPLLSMQDWVKGMPINNSRSNQALNKAISNTITYDEVGRISSFQHDSGWQINYGSYRRVNEHWLPHQVTLKSATSQIKIRITEWTI
ncbi:outer membrane lipoprotein LolB [Alteromonadaceae bacterium M269]|nr:outer membrane lipoprotein LolB [Alteromonadaceae bacterium M269]